MTMTSRCPNEEVLNDYLADRLPGDQRKHTEDHLSRCPLCRELISVFDGVQTLEASETMIEAPEQVTQRAQKQIQRLGTHSLSTRLGHGLRDMKHELKRWSRRLEWFFGPEPVLVRNAEKAKDQDVVVVNRRIGDMDASIEIEKCGDDKACLRIDLSSPEDPPPAVRVTLKTGSREIASCMCINSPALFEDIPFDAYVLVFSLKGITQGEYSFELRDTRHGH